MGSKFLPSRVDLLLKGGKTFHRVASPENVSIPFDIFSYSYLQVSVPYVSFFL